MSLDQINYSQVALDAAGCYRAIELTLDEFETIHPENPAGLGVIKRFVELHGEFYDRVILLTAEETGKIDNDFREEVLAEKQGLKAMLEHITRGKGFFETLTGSANRITENWSSYFAKCVEDILEGHFIDPDTNELYFVDEEE